MSPVSLYPKKATTEEKIKEFLYENRELVFKICLIIAILLILTLIGLVVRLMFGICVIDSGNYYNHLKDVI